MAQAQKKKARHPSAVKRARQNVRRRDRNKSVISKMRTVRKQALQADTPETRQATARAFQSAADRAAKRGIIHQRTAARLKSRLAKKK
ncbi:MAG TPA: 30S ribosomal protein S20 [bacterium]|nr:30S ribosomal protein S20 [bacterium]